MFENVKWQNDRMLMDGLVFRLQHYMSEEWELGEECFIFFKIKDLIDQYGAFFASRPDFRPQNVFELGLWDGGSLAFWFENLRPKKQVGIDLIRRGDSDYFLRYVGDRGLGERIKTHWGVDQSDSKMLREIVSREFDGPLDLVIDDASHLYGPTRSSFECLFPLLRPGGLYVIEDWAWEHWREFSSPDHPMVKEESLTRLVVELLEATGSSFNLIRSLTTYQGFTVIERGEADLSGPGGFELADHIRRRPRPDKVNPIKKLVSNLRLGAK
jgi:SAM-dependent methyltransferase